MATKRARPKKHIVLLLSAVVALAVFVAACGGGDSGETSPAAEPADTAPAPTSETPASSGNDGGRNDGGGNDGDSSSGDESVSAPESNPVPASNPTAEALEPSASPPAPINSDLPDVPMLRVSTGEELSLSSLAPASRPLLLWFWAPH